MNDVAMMVFVWPCCRLRGHVEVYVVISWDKLWALDDSVSVYVAVL